MEKLTNILDVSALIVQFTGALFMYRNSPANEMPWGTTFQDTVTPKRLKRKNKRLSLGFFILTVGIGIALLSLIIKDIGFGKRGFASVPNEVPEACWQSKVLASVNDAQFQNAFGGGSFKARRWPTTSEPFPSPYVLFSETLRNMPLTNSKPYFTFMHHDSNIHNQFIRLLSVNPEDLNRLVPISASLAKAQSVVNVNPLTGAGNVFIPVYTVSSGNVSVPISLSYSGNGIKPKDVEGTAGMGWQLNAGGQVSRVVRGLPDDCTKDNSGATMLGWMSTSNTGATYAKTFTPQNNGSTCSTGNADVTAINANMPYTYDTEPDVFYVNAPGLSLQMVFNRDDQKFHPVGYQDLIINYSVQGGTGNNTGNITSFTVTNDKGLTYVFAAPESVTQTTQAYNNVAPNYLTTKYKQYKQGITFADSWSLVSITDLNANAVTFYYTTGLVRNSTDPIALYLGGATSQTLEYKVLQAVTPQLLGSISTVNVNSSKIVLGFTWNTPILSTQTGQTYIASIVGMGRNY
eukprot:gene7924-7993_t